MPICSYLVHTRPDDAADVADRLSALPGCDATPADDGDLVVLVTDTDSDADERALHERLQAEPGVRCLVMTFGADAGTGAAR